jgi:hypothetical protein
LKDTVAPPENRHFDRSGPVEGHRRPTREPSFRPERPGFFLRVHFL